MTGAGPRPVPELDLSPAGGTPRAATAPSPSPAPTVTPRGSVPNRVAVTPAGTGPVAVDPGAIPPLPRDGRPWADSRFWILQLLVLALALVRLAVTLAFHLPATSLTLELSTLVLFVVPVVVGAMAFGLPGALVTAGWVTLVCLPRIGVAAGDRDFAAVWSEVVQLVVLDGLALLIGQRTSAERKARRDLDAGRFSLLRSEALYRSLFDSNLAPILIVDADGRVVEANPAAHELFGAPAAGATTPERLVDVVGPVAASGVLARLVTVDQHGPAGGGGTGAAGAAPELDRSGDTLAFSAEGRTVVYRLGATDLADTRDGRRLQVVFQDVTEETRRRDVLQAYAARVVHGQEDERRHLAQELHDGPLQELILLCRDIDALAEHDGSAPPSTHDRAVPPLAELRQRAEGAVAELRTIARGLRPPVLDDLGLAASLGQLVSEARRRGAFDATLGVNGVERRLPSAVELALFRIAQEGLANAEKHAAAVHVAVGLDFEAGGVRLLVTDDGVGFDGAEGQSAATSLGLPGMAERARLVGGTMTLHTGEGAGCSLDVWVPTTE